MSDTPVTFIAKLTAKSGSEDTLAKELTALVAPSRQEPGCLHYILHVSEENPRQFVIYESWKNQAAFEAHMGMPHFAGLMGKMHTLIDGPPTRDILRTLG